MTAGEDEGEPGSHRGGTQQMRMTSPMLKALSHPLRRKILELMSEPRRATDLARLLGEPANSVSFHLRELAKAEMIMEAPEHARDKRDRVWVGAAGGYGVPTPENPIDSQGELALRSFMDQERLDLFDLISRILAWAPEWSSGRDPRMRAELSTGLFELTEQEAMDMIDEFHKLQTKYRKLSKTPSDEERKLWRVVLLMGDDTLPPANQ